MTIPLSRAMLCLNDDVIYDGASGTGCPACGSAATWPLARWLNRRLNDVLVDLVQRAPIVPITISPRETLAEALKEDAP